MDFRVWQLELRGERFGDEQPIHFDKDGPLYAGWDAPTSNITARVNGNGSSMSGASRVATKTLTFPLAVHVDGEEEAQVWLERFAAAWAPVDDGPIELTFRTPVRTYTVTGLPGRWSQVNDFAIRYGYVKVVAEFELTDVLFYDANVNVDVIGVERVAGGLSWPVVWPMTFGSISPGSLVVTNEGNRSTGLILLLGASTDVVAPQFGVLPSGEVLSFPTLTISAGQWLYVDTAKRIARIQSGSSDTSGTSVTHLINYSASTWPLLPIGTHLVVLSAIGDGVGLVGWRSAWLI